MPVGLDVDETEQGEISSERNGGNHGTDGELTIETPAQIRKNRQRTLWGTG